MDKRWKTLSKRDKRNIIIISIIAAAVLYLGLNQLFIGAFIKGQKVVTDLQNLGYQNVQIVDRSFFLIGTGCDYSGKWSPGGQHHAVFTADVTDKNGQNLRIRVCESRHINKPARIVR